MIGFGRYNSLGIGLAVHLRDQFSQKAQGINNQMNQMYNNSRRIAGANLQGITSVGASMALMGYGIMRFTRRAIEELAVFEKELSTIKAVADDNTLSMAALEKEIRKVGTTGVFSIDQIAKAASTLGRAGFTRLQIKETLQAASDLGAAGDIDVNTASDSIGRILNMFDLAANQSGHIADLLAVASNKSAVSIQDLIESLKYSGDVLKSLNIPMEESLAIFMKLGNAGLRGSMAGTSVANMIRYLNKAVTDFKTKRQDQAINMLGLRPEDIIDANGNMRSMVDIMDTLRASLQGMPTNKAQAIMEALTGVRGQRALIPLMALTKNTKSMKEFLDMLKDPSTSGAVRRIAEQMMDNVWGDLEKMRDSWKNFQIEFARLPGLRLLIQGLTKVLNIITKIISTPFGKVLGSAVVIFGAIALVAGTVLTTTGFLMNTVRQLGLAYSTMGIQANVALNTMTASTMRLNAANMMGGFGGRGTMGVMGNVGRMNRGAVFGRSGNLVNMAGLVPLGRTAASTTGNVAKFGGVLGRVTPMLSRLIPSLSGLGSGLLAILPIILLIGFIGAAIYAIADMLGLSGGIDRMFGGGDEKKKNWIRGVPYYEQEDRQREMREQQESGTVKKMRNSEEWKQAVYNLGKNSNPQYSDNNVVINIDGYQTVNKKIEGNQEEEIYQDLGGF